MANPNQAVSMEVANMPQFQAAMREYLARTEKDLSEALNTTLFYIARGASRNTIKADRAKYESELGVQAYKILAYKKGEKKGQARFNKKGQIRTQRVMKAGATLANLIINARLGRAKSKGLYGSEMSAAVRKLLGKRARSVGTLKAGWLGAIKTLADAVGESRGVDGASSIIKGRSKAKIAKPGWNPSASLEYLVNSFDKNHIPYIDARVRDALKQAFDDETRSKLDYLAKKMGKTASIVAAKQGASVRDQLIKIVPELAKNTMTHGARRIGP